MATAKYFPKEIEEKWSSVWEKEATYKADLAKEKKTYTLAMFPYPSGAGLHVGHVRIYTGTDILARFFRMNGYGVLNPMGWDAFGLPAENAAIKAKKNPMDMVPENIANFKRQMQSLGFSFDWSREFATTDPEYYKWTQWLFLKLYGLKNEKGERLIYRTKAPINWCPSCKTGLANEEVLPDCTHERCGNKTEEKLLPQWMMRITDYAERLLSDLDTVEWKNETGETKKGLDWPKGILEMQRNWIGKKEGAIIPHTVEGIDFNLETFTAYPAWSFADSFIVIAPEHPLAQLSKSEEVKNYIEGVKKETNEDRMAENKEKTGVFTGFYAIDPFRKGVKMPIWIANFALMGFGTGAIRCSAHDARDVEFAQKYGLKHRDVVSNDDKSFVSAHDNKGVLHDSGPFDGREVGEITQEFMDWMEKEGIGKRHVTYHLRDWIFSRQRYWGEPFPFVYCDKCGDENGVVPVLEENLPVTLPHIDSYEPTDTGESPLSQVQEWVNTKCPQCGGPAKRETDTMPNWAGSCWYFLYFARSSSVIPSLSKDLVNDFRNIKKWGEEIEGAAKDWMPVQWYLGGAEHAVLHLLYARFWTKAFADLGLLGFEEPFLRLRNVGMVLAADNRKMSKSLGNVVNPDDVIAEFGADTLRVYEAFIAPFNAEVAWSTRAVQGSYRFISRIWQIYNNPAKITNDEGKVDKMLLAKLQSTIIKITTDMPDVKYNTSVAALMEFLNEWEKNDSLLSQSNAKSYLKLLAPIAPYITEELWHTVFGEAGSIHLSQWPKVDQNEAITTNVNMPIQINGKVRDILVLSPKADKEKVLNMALKSQKIAKWVEGKKYEVIFVQGKILNLIIKE